MKTQLKRPGLSLLELLAAITILAILAAIILPRFGDHARTAKKRACAVNKGNIEVQSQLWYRTKGAWPATGLSDIGANQTFFPEGLPTCPVDGSTYQLDAITHRVSGHIH
jgi:prepilin-type N-terminal cleavage/methylation domain-containing protein